MEDKSINLCDTNGVEAFSCLFDKLNDQSKPLRLGSIALHRISISHFRDGIAVVRAETDNEQVLVFQFEPGVAPFSFTAMGEDGTRLCQPESEL